MTGKFCQVCQTGITKTLFWAKGYRFYQCSNCQLIRIFPFPSNQSLGSTYSQKNIHGDFLKDNPQVKFFGRLPFFESFFNFYLGLICQQRVKQVLMLKKSGRILDVGFGDAQFLARFNNRHWQISGVEINELLAAEAKAKLKRATIYIQNVQNIKLPHDSYDVITLWHTFEHLKKPLKILRKMELALKPKGYLVIEVPNATSLNRRIFGPNWQQLIVPEHLFFWSQKSLSALFEKTNLTVLKISHLGIFSFSGVSSLANWLRSLGPSSPIATIISLFFLPISVVINAFSFTMRENLLFIAKKPNS